MKCPACKGQVVITPPRIRAAEREVVHVSYMGVRPGGLPMVDVETLRAQRYTLNGMWCMGMYDGHNHVFHFYDRGDMGEHTLQAVGLLAAGGLL